MLVPFPDSMLKSPILNYHGKTKEENSCKLVVYKPGKLKLEVLNLLKNGQRDIQRKLFVLDLMLNLKESWLVLKMVLLILSL
jgi:hypothetical protein